MALILTDVGAQVLLTKAFNVSKDLTLRLFANDFTPTDASVQADFTEAAGGGYNAIPLTNDAIISLVGTAPNAIAQAAYSQVSFNFTGALTTNGTVYGYYVTNAAGQVLFAEKAASSYTPANNGDALLLTPVFKLSSGTPS